MQKFDTHGDISWFHLLFIHRQQAVVFGDVGNPRVSQDSVYRLICFVSNDLFDFRETCVRPNLNAVHI